MGKYAAAPTVAKELKLRRHCDLTFTVRFLEFQISPWVTIEFVSQDICGGGVFSNQRLEWGHYRSGSERSDILSLFGVLAQCYA
jgi:hypothetical protein